MADETNELPFLDLQCNIIQSNFFECRTGIVNMGQVVDFN